jgi:hypothetical protein
MDSRLEKQTGRGTFLTVKIVNAVPSNDLVRRTSGRDKHSNCKYTETRMYGGPHQIDGWHKNSPTLITS